MASPETLEALDLVARMHDRAFFAGERTEATIRAVEAGLGVAFPASYRLFVLRLGAGSIGAFEIYGVIDEDFADSGIPDAAWMTSRVRAESSLPPSYLVIGSDGMGAYYVLDCELEAHGAESPVFIWDPAQSVPGRDPEPIASDFGSFFLELSRRASA